MKFPTATDASNTTAQVLKQGEVQGSDVAAHSAGVLDIKTTILPDADALSSQPSTDTVMNFGAGLSL